MWYWYMLGVYLCGVVVAFLVSAYLKSKESGTEKDNFYVFCTFGWFLMIIVLVLALLVFLWEEGLPALFFGLLNKTAKLFEYIRNYKPRQKRIAIPIPTPAVVQQYRQPGAHPCIACGTPTSVDQSNMECVESEAAQYARLDI